MGQCPCAVWASMHSDASCVSNSLTLSELGQRPVRKLVQHLIDDQHRSPTSRRQRVTPGTDLQKKIQVVMQAASMVSSRALT